MAERQWSPQKERVFAFDTNMCVSAGAGSGKTAALVELDSRFLSGDTPVGTLKMEEILAITFTEKAAGEMKERIRQVIEARLSEERNPDRQDLWTEARRALLSAHISTFHSFCTRILKENPIEAHLDPHFEVLSEEQAQEILATSADRLLFRKIREGDESVEALVLDLGARELSRLLVSGLSALRNAGGEASSLPTLLKAREKEAVELLSRARRRLVEIVDEIALLRENPDIKKSRSLGQRLAAFASSAGAIKNGIERLSPDSSPSDATFLDDLTAIFKGKIPAAAQGIREELAELIEPKEGTIPLFLRFFRALPAQAAVSSLLVDLDEAYGSEKTAHSCLDFDDLLFLCRNLLRDDHRVRRRYKGAFKVILVDEFQDTNELQRQIVYLLSEKQDQEQALPPGARIEELSLEPRKLFVVGDAKQSIYFFRGADVEVFTRVMEDITQRGGEVVSFQDNFRTLDTILEVINPLFAGIPPRDGRPFQFRFHAEDHLSPTRSLPERCSRVEVIFSSPLREGEDRISAARARALEAESLANRILLATDPGRGVKVSGEGKGDVRTAEFGDIALLFRSLTQVGIYETALRAKNIPYYLVKGRGFFDCQEILDVLHALRYIAGTRIGISLAGILRSPLAGLSDDTLLALALSEEGHPRDLVKTFLFGDFPDLRPDERERLRKCRSILNDLEALKDHLSLSELIEEVFARFDYTAVLLSTFQGEQKAANAAKLVRMARTYEASGIFGLEDFVQYLSRRTAYESHESEAQLEKENPGAVLIMSIHQAKGLEFPIVVVPDMGRSDPPNRHQVRCSVSLGLASKYRDPATGDMEKHYLYKRIDDECRERERAESLRLLYVALTRARDYLILSSGYVRTPQDTWKNVVDQFLGDHGREFLQSDEEEREVMGIRLLKRSALKAGSVGSAPAPVDRHPLLRNPGAPHFSALLETLAGPDRDHAEKTLEKIFDYRKPAPSVIHFTPTSIMAYDFCPRKYLYDFILSRGEEFRRASVEAPGEEDLEQVRGWAAHRALEEADFTKDLGALSKDLEQHLIKIGEGNALLRNRTKEIHEALLRFISAPETKVLGLSDRQAALFREHPFTACLDGRPRIFLHGYMDLVGRSARGEWFLIDYKYARNEREKILDYSLQILCYAIALREALNAGELEAYLVFLQEKPTAYVRIPTDDAKIAEFQIRLRTIAAEILRKSARKDESAWEKTQPEKCRLISCPYLERCWGAS